jgi:hypothetical protein
MLRPSLTAVVLLTAATASAGDASRICDMRIAADVDLTPTQVIVDDGRRRHVIEDGVVRRDGRELALDARRQRLAREYTEAMRAAVPAISELALRGALLGLESLALVSAGLSGDGAAVDGAVARIEKLAMQLHLQFDGRHLAAGKLAPEPSFERDLGALAADAAGQFAGSLLSLVGTALFDPAAAEARSEYLERLVERRIEPRAAQIEAQADRLCAMLRKLDALESQLGLFDVIVDERDGRAI